MNDERPSAFYRASSLGSTLLSAGRDEEPSDEALARTLATVGAGAAVVALTTGVAAGASMSMSTAAKGSVALGSFTSLVKWLGIGALSGTVVAGITHAVAPAPVAAPLVNAPVVAVVPAAEHASESPPARSMNLESAEAIPTEEEPPKPAVLRTEPRSEPEPAAAKAPLAAEVALVDRARASLASGAPARALEELSHYETSFRDPRLLPEVLFLRLEAHLASGDTARARQTAEQSLRLFPRSPHAARAREVIERNAEKEK
jgi:hypothetical protein